MKKTNTKKNKQKEIQKQKPSHYYKYRYYYLSFSILLLFTMILAMIISSRTEPVVSPVKIADKTAEISSQENEQQPAYKASINTSYPGEELINFAVNIIPTLVVIMLIIFVVFKVIDIFNIGNCPI